MSADFVFGSALTVALFAVALLTAGGVDPAPNTWTEIVLTLIGAGLGIAALVSCAPARAWGLVTLLLFAVLAALTAASVLWSVQPENSWVEAGRTASYLAAFGGALALARFVPARWPAVVGAIAAVAALISLFALLVKVFPETLDPNETFGRLRAPFDYFNATGLIGALGLPACLWAGARREPTRVLRALSVPAIAILGTVIVLSYSRGALLVTVLGVAVWFAVVPLRLRGAVVLAAGLAGAVVLSGYALTTHALTHDLVPLQSRTSAGHGFGVVLVVVLALLTAGGYACALAMDRVPVAADTRRRVGIALLVVVALIPAAGVVALAASSRGLTGEVSHLVSKLTNANSGATNAPGRLIQLGNSRGRYWNEGLKVGEHALLKGTGALGYGTAVTRYTTDANTVSHAHSYVIETFADFGLIGVAVSLALLVAWMGAVRRTLAGSGSPEHAAERAGLLTLLCVVIVFGAHSAIDWTWFIPGTAIPALVCAGWLAGRGPIAAPVGRSESRRRLLDSPGVGAVALTVVTLTLLGTWEIWQPLRSADDQSAATAALEHGDSNAAIADARTAADVDPVDVEPLWQLAAIYSGRGDNLAARRELQSATARQPENPQTWLQLGEFELQVHQPRRALRSLRRAVALDQGSAEAAAALAEAQRQAGVRG
jgi:hypothetical protein